MGIANWWPKRTGSLARKCYAHVKNANIFAHAAVVWVRVYLKMQRPERGFAQYARMNIQISDDRLRARAQQLRYGTGCARWEVLNCRATIS